MFIKSTYILVDFYLLGPQYSVASIKIYKINQIAECTGHVKVRKDWWMDYSSL